MKSVKTERLLGVAWCGLLALGIFLAIQFEDRLKNLAAITARPLDFIDNKPPTLVRMVFGRDDLMQIDYVSNSRDANHFNLHAFWKLVKAASIN
jgi:hypothetical protein